MTQKILDALQKLDVGNDSHWTGEGLPRLETVRFFAGDGTLSREAVTLAAPEFTRSAATLPSATAQQGEESPAQAAIGAPAGATSTEPAAGAPGPVASETQSAQGDQREQENGVEGNGPAPGSESEPSKSTSSVTEEEIANAKRRLAYAQREAAAANQDLAKATEALDELLDRQAKTADPQSLSHAIQDYHASQKRLLMQRATQRQVLAEVGIKLSDLLPMRSKLDAAFGRRNDRGAARPDFVGKKPE